MKVFPKESLCISHRRILCLAGIGTRRKGDDGLGGRIRMRWKDGDQLWQ